MAQHYLHSKESRNLARTVNKLTENEAEEWFAVARWGDKEQQACPKCGVFRKHYRRSKSKRWRCAETECGYEFSVTSRTPFQSHKLSHRDLIQLILVFENGAKSRSLLEASRCLGFTPKTIQANFGKIREWMVRNMDLKRLSGIVHMDGGYFGGKPRKPNRRTKMPKDALKIRFGTKVPKDPEKPWIEAGMTRKNWFKRFDKRVVMSLCESAGHGGGVKRVMAFVCRSESESVAKTLVERFISEDAILMTDEGNGFARLNGMVEHYTVRHAEEYVTSEGVSDNMCETFYSRMRRSEYGTLHGFRPKYLQDYTCEFVWRHNMRRHSQTDRVDQIISGLMASPPSTWWRGYWQGRHREGEIGLEYFLARMLQGGDAAP